MAIHNKIASLMDKKRGVITLHFYDGRKITGNVKAGNASFGVDEKLLPTTDCCYAGRRNVSFDFYSLISSSSG